MLPVFLCEDEPDIREMERKLIEQYLMIQGYDMELVLDTGNPREILEQVKKKPVRGIYFLDVDLKYEGLDGFLLGKEIRRYDSYGFVIYVTAFRDLAYKTFQHHIEVLDYIVKENQEAVRDGICRCFDTIVERLSRENLAPLKACYTVKSGELRRHVPVEDILFFETDAGSHRITLHTENERISFIGQMREIEKELPDTFFRCHRGFLVNICRVQEVNLKANEVIFVNGETCLVSRGLRSGLMKRIAKQFVAPK